MQRTRHEGTIYRHKSGRWAGSLSLGRDPTTGRRLRRTVYGASVADVRKQLEALQGRRSGGLSLAPERRTVQQHLEAWLDDRRRTVRRQTSRGYELICETHLIPGVGRHRLDALRPDHIRAMVATWTAAPSTVRHRLLILRIALGAAVSDGILARNPCDRVQGPGVEKIERRTLTPDEARRLISAARTDPAARPFALALVCGLRRGEIYGLAWSALDLDAGMLHVRETLQRNDGEYRLMPPKSAASARSIPLPRVAVEMLSRIEVHLVCPALLQRAQSAGSVHQLRRTSPIHTPVAVPLAVRPLPIPCASWPSPTRPPPSNCGRRWGRSETPSGRTPSGSGRFACPARAGT